MNVSSPQIQPDYQKAYAFNYATAQEIPKQCCLAAKLLEAQPLFDGRGTIVEKCKVIPLNDWSDCRIFDIFNENVNDTSRKNSDWYNKHIEKLLGSNSAWNISSFGCGNHQLIDLNGKLIEQGLEFLIYNKERCSLKTLEQAYREVYDTMRHGWVEANPLEHPELNITWMDCSNCALFLKNERSLMEEEILIRFLANKFGFEHRMFSDSMETNVENPRKNGLYMWIPKNELHAVIEKFGFNFTFLDKLTDRVNSKDILDKKIKSAILNKKHFTEAQSQKKSGGKRFRQRQFELKRQARLYSEQVALLTSQKT